MFHLYQLIPNEKVSGKEKLLKIIWRTQYLTYSKVDQTQKKTYPHLSDTK